MSAPASPIKVYLIDGTYELFRAFFGSPTATAPDPTPDSVPPGPHGPLAGMEVGAVRGLLRSLLALIRENDATHLGVAFDHVIESFRNRLFPGYKTGEGIDPLLLAQFPLAEEAVRTLGLTVWPMVEFEADDALATAAARCAALPEVEQVLICSPDKDLAQCVRGQKVVVFDRLRRKILDAPLVQLKYGVPPRSIPDFLALMGDSADGIPGLPRWGEKSAAAVLRRYPHLEDIPDDASRWDVTVRGSAALAESLRAGRDEALLYRRLATLRTDVPLGEDLSANADALRWRGARRGDFVALCARLGETRLPERVSRFDDSAQPGAAPSVDGAQPGAAPSID